MRRLTTFFATVIMCAIPMCAPAMAQTQTFTDENVDYTLELPSSTWRVVARPDGMQQHAEFIYGDRMDGYLRIRKEIVDAGTSPADLAARDKDEKLRFLPGYVDGKEERFAGRLSGVTVSYEYTSSGKSMVGRIYFLQADTRTVYVLHFTGLRDKLARIRNQTDLMARTFAVK